MASTPAPRRTWREKRKFSLFFKRNSEYLLLLLSTSYLLSFKRSWSLGSLKLSKGETNQSINQSINQSVSQSTFNLQRLNWKKRELRSLLNNRGWVPSCCFFKWLAPVESYFSIYYSASFDEESAMWPSTEIDPRVGLNRANCCKEKTTGRWNTADLLNKNVITRKE